MVRGGLHLNPELNPATGNKNKNKKKQGGITEKDLTSHNRLLMLQTSVSDQYLTYVQRLLASSLARLISSSAVRPEEETARIATAKCTMAEVKKEHLIWAAYFTINPVYSPPLRIC